MVETYSKKIDEFGDSFLGYFLYDINNDGLPELWIKSGTCVADYQFMVYIYNKGLKRIYQGHAGHMSFYQGKDYILTWWAHMGSSSMNKITYNEKKGKLKTETIFTQNLSEEETVDDYIEPKEPHIELRYSDDKNQYTIC